MPRDTLCAEIYDPELKNYIARIITYGLNVIRKLIRTITNSNSLDELASRLFGIDIQDPFWRLYVVYKLERLKRFLECFKLAESFDTHHPSFRTTDIQHIFFADYVIGYEGVGAYVDLYKYRSNVIFLAPVFFREYANNNFPDCSRMIIHEACHISLELQNDSLRDNLDSTFRELYKEYYHGKFKPGFCPLDESLLSQCYIKYKMYLPEIMQNNFRLFGIKEEKKWGNADNWAVFIIEAGKICHLY